MKIRASQIGKLMTSFPGKCAASPQISPNTPHPKNADIGNAPVLPRNMRAKSRVIAFAKHMSYDE